MCVPMFKLLHSFILTDTLKSMLESSQLLKSALKELCSHANEDVKSKSENLSRKLYSEQ